MGRSQRTSVSRLTDALVVGFLFALPGWVLLQVFDIGVLWALLVPAAVGVALGWLFGNVLLFLCEVVLGLFE